MNRVLKNKYLQTYLKAMVSNRERITLASGLHLHRQVATFRILGRDVPSECQVVCVRSQRLELQCTSIIRDADDRDLFSDG